MRKPIVVQMTAQAAETMHTFVDLCPVEISGFGIITESNGKFVVSEVFITKQEAWLDFVILDAADQCNKLDELMARGVDPATIAFQWHSHVNEVAKFSTRDIAQINAWEGPHMMSCVVNKHARYSCRLDIFRPYRKKCDVVLAVEDGAMDPNTRKQCAREIQEKVTIRRKRHGLRAPR